MRARISLLFAFLALAQDVSAGSREHAAQLSVTERFRQSAPVVIAHRGCWEFGPENSMRALKACFGSGVDMVEGDVRSTKDGVIVLMHDATLDRTTNTSGALKDYSYAELAPVKLREGAGSTDTALTDEAIPRLSDVLKAAKGHVLLLLHVKEANYDQIYRAVAAEHAQSRVAFLVEAPLSDLRASFSRLVGKVALVPVVWECRVVKRNTDCYEGDALAQVFTDYKPLHPVAYLPASGDRRFFKGSAPAIREHGREILGGDNGLAGDPEPTWSELFEMNVHLVLTDHPFGLVRYLNGAGPR